MMSYRKYIDAKMDGLKLKHTEAFMVMTYECEECGHVERIWNSRDGVTPFIIGCRRCDSNALHVDWGNDKFVPDYQPQKGERIFIDYTDETAKVVALELIESFAETDNPVRNEEQFIKSIIEDCKRNADLMVVK
ncbi:MAG: hypothetical protein ACOCRO_04430 [Halanaerobiales bacterium]